MIYRLLIDNKLDLIEFRTKNKAKMLEITHTYAEVSVSINKLSIKWSQKSNHEQILGKSRSSFISNDSFTQ